MGGSARKSRRTTLLCSWQTLIPKMGLHYAIHIPKYDLL